MISKEANVLPFLIAGIVLLSFFVLALVLCFICFFLVFYSTKRSRIDKDEYPTPKGEIYDPYRDQMIEWVKSMRGRKCLDVSVTSYDGLTLRGRYFEFQKGAPIEILFHGYRGSSERDMAGGVHRCTSLGRSALIVDQRAAGKSQGRVITFGAKEHRDVRTWVDFVIENIDKDAKIIITGISMGAATVMTASSCDMPENVVGVLADCGYTSTEDMRDIKLPANLLYPFTRLGAIIFGGFDPNASSPIESMKKCRLPIIFYHGDDDAFVPCYMSEQNYEACASENKKLVIIKGAGHGLCFPVDRDLYYTTLDEFFSPILQESQPQNPTK